MDFGGHDLLKNEICIQKYIQTFDYNVIRIMRIFSRVQKKELFKSPLCD